MALVVVFLLCLEHRVVARGVAQRAAEPGVSNFGNAICDRADCLKIFSSRNDGGRSVVGRCLHCGWRGAGWPRLNFIDFASMGDNTRCLI